jgi:hypothetical protein
MKVHITYKNGKKQTIENVERIEQRYNPPINRKPRCEGWHRTGIFQMGGTGRWEQCESSGIVMLRHKSTETGKMVTLPACQGCWDECIAGGITIKEAIPLNEVTQNILVVQKDGSFQTVEKRHTTTIEL